MPRHKPQGWPRYMVTRHLRKGGTAYYWTPPTWAAQKGFPLSSEALGNDYAEAKRRCDDVLNRQFDDWRRRDQAPSPSAWLAVGTFDWMVTVYRSSPSFLNKGEKTRRDYDASLNLISRHVLKDGRTFGSLVLKSITPGAADRLFEKLKKKPGGGERVRTAILAMRVAQRAWNIARRAKPKIVPFENPFAKMGLSYKPKATRPVTYAEMMRFVEATDVAGEASLGTAAMIAFFWLQRPADIIKRLTWSHYRPADAPNKVRIFHHKTGEVVELPLYDYHDGSALWPEIMTRLDNAARHGTLIVTRDKLDRLRKVHLPWSRYYFSHRVAAIRTAAGIDPDVKFMGLRHGGNVEGADAGLSDAQLRALSGHRTTAALLRYAQVTERQRVVGARIRRDARTKKEGLSK